MIRPQECQQYVMWTELEDQLYTTACTDHLNPIVRAHLLNTVWVPLRRMINLAVLQWIDFV